MPAAKPLKHGSEMVGDRKFEMSLFEKILAHTDKRAKKQKVEYLKPSKAALYGLQVRFDNQKKVDNTYGKSKSRGRKQEQSMYHINNQLANVKLNNRHSMPLDIKKILSEQKEYDFETEKKAKEAELYEKKRRDILTQQSLQFNSTQDTKQRRGDNSLNASYLDEAQMQDQLKSVETGQSAYAPEDSYRDQADQSKARSMLPPLSRASALSASAETSMDGTTKFMKRQRDGAEQTKP